MCKVAKRASTAPAATSCTARRTTALSACPASAQKHPLPPATRWRPPAASGRWRRSRWRAGRTAPSPAPQQCPPAGYRGVGEEGGVGRPVDLEGKAGSQPSWHIAPLKATQPHQAKFPMPTCSCVTSFCSVLMRSRSLDTRRTLCRGVSRSASWTRGEARISADQCQLQLALPPPA